MKNIERFLKNNQVWVMFCREGNDGFFQRLITSLTTAPSYSIITAKHKFLLAHHLDFNNIENFDGRIYEYYKDEDLKVILNDIFKELNFPSEVLLNYSSNSQLDSIGHGSFLYIKKLLKQIYFDNALKISSAENIILKLLDSKTEEEIFYFDYAARRTNQILNNVFTKLKIGMTEIEIANLVHNEMLNKPEEFEIFKVIKEGYSWSKDTCPIVLIGKNLLKGGHALPSEKKLCAGETIYFDFGIQIALENGIVVSSDIQRMGYVLKNDEVIAPDNVQKVFDTLTKAIELGKENAVISKKGYQIDKIVRKYITSCGYPDYPHGTGHSVGRNAHGIGTCLSMKANKSARLYLNLNGIYTIEPRIQIDNGGSIEEMIVITENGAKFLGTPQKELILIKG